MKKTPWILLLALTSSFAAFAGGVRGTIRGDDGNPLAFATIYVRQTESGAVSDADGNFEVTLAPGHYDIVFHYLGFETYSQAVDVGTDFISLKIALKAQVIQLQAVTVKAGKEDPAYTIMRKAIAKAKYHTQQIDKYTAKVYIKGKGQLKDYPWLAKKALEKEGITKDRVFIQESVSEITYTRPNKFDEKVIAVYTNGNSRNTSPNAYVFGSLYEPEIGETVSPLSPKAFSYYRFTYEGTFKDRTYYISKIKVTPRSKGDNVFDGTIYIVEDWWSIHSTDLNVTKLGIKFHVKQIYNPIEDKAWLPVSQQFYVEGRIFGFEFVADYLATVKDYKITLNPALPMEMTVIDETVQKEQAKQVEKKYSKKGQQLQERLEAGKEVTRKELNQMTREYEKAEREEQKAPEVIEETTFKVDSMAYKKDSTFWSEMRPVQLTKEEVRGYKVNDSISEVQKRREEGDSLKPSKNKGFQPWDILIGDRYKLGKTSNLEIHTPWGGFNTVEGWNLIYRMSFYKRWVKKDSLNPDLRPKTYRLQISPIARYAFSRKVLSGIMRVDFRTQTRRFTLEGGKYIHQYNGDEPIHPLVNTLTTLFLEDNLMKLYEREYVDFRWREQVSKFVTTYTQWTWSHRSELANASSITWVDYKEKDYTPNAPVNAELGSTSFQPNNAFVGVIGIEARPWQKFRMRNGNRQRVSNSSPLLTAEYRRGFGALNSDVSFEMLELGVRQQVKFGIRGTLDVLVKGGTFFSGQRMFFMDYKHFLGNKTPFVTTDPVGSFRLLDYYAYSTHDKYFTANVHYHLRKFLITRITYVRLAGITENLFVNYLASPTSNNYTELGYGLDGILRVFRLEFATAFQQGTYQAMGFRIGISSSLGSTFDD
ncbi:MAG: carboxypeptidase-like regulatory domain-containing protein [Cyclobacteriaceae bacterium]|nr:carboxypeptidase-like regulatory domain-containing protein [Cyclobacteriaceae bacterium]